MAYTGSVDLISGIRPKNNGAFPLVDAKDVYVTDEKRLDAALDEKMPAADALPKPEVEGTEGQFLKNGADGATAWGDVTAEEVKVTDEKNLDEVLAEKADADDVIPKPEAAGTEGDVLRINSSGAPEWTDPAMPTDSQVREVVTDWLEENPEAIPTELGDQIDDLKSAFGDITGNRIVDFSDPALRQYIVTNGSAGSTVQWDTPSVSAGTQIKWAVVECSPGDVFTINGHGGNSDRLYTFLDTDKKILESPRAAASATAVDLVLTAPANAAYLVINDETDKNSYTGILLESRLNDVSSKTDLIGELCDDLTERKYTRKSIAAIDGITKLAGYSFSATSSGGGPAVDGTELSGYDSYYFFADAYTALYFASAAPANPAYIAVTVGYNPTGEWYTDSNGHKRMDCSSSARYRKSENNLPTSEDPLNAANAIVIFTVNADTTVDVYLNDTLQIEEDCIPLAQSLGTSENIAMSQNAVKEAIDAITKRTAKLKYTQEAGAGNSTERVDIYIPTFTGYIDYQFVHTEIASRNADVWRVDAAYAVDETFANPMTITTTGEWEIALKLDGRSDFAGGNAHGDEVLDSIVFMLDGVETDISDYTELTDFSELRILEKTNMYDPADSTTLIGVHTSAHIFSDNSDQLVINQTFRWSVSETLGFSYMGMFPVGKNVTTKWYNNTDNMPSAISYGYYDGIKNAYLYDTTAGVFCEFSSHKLPDVPGTSFNKKFYLTDNGDGAYNKCYYVLCGTNTNVTSGTLWESETVYNISKK